MQGVAADLVGSIGSGDLTMGIGLTSTLHTIGVVQAVLDAPFRNQSPRALLGLAGVMFMRRSDAAIYLALVLLLLR